MVATRVDVGSMTSAFRQSRAGEASPPIKVAFFIPDLRGGGAERIAIDYLRHLDRSRFAARLILCERRGAHLERIPEDVCVTSLGKNSRWSLPLLIYRFRRLAERTRPDIVVSFLWYSDAIQLQARRRSDSWCAVCALHSVPGQLRRERSGSLKLWWMQRLYRRADGAMAVSQRLAEEFRSLYRIPDDKPVWDQPNPFPLEQIRQAAESSNPPPWRVRPGARLVVVGRLEPVKGHDVLLRALAEIRSDLDWHLKILGVGPEESRLRGLASDIGLGSRVEFLGYLDNPYPTIRSADLLVLPSRAEAFPSVLVEAMALGTPTVAADCPTGPADVLDAGRAGCLVRSGDPTALARGIAGLLEDGTERGRLRQAGMERVEQWDASIVLPLFESRLENLLVSPTRSRAPHT